MRVNRLEADVVLSRTSTMYLLATGPTLFHCTVTASPPVMCSSGRGGGWITGKVGDVTTVMLPAYGPDVLGGGGTG